MDLLKDIKEKVLVFDGSKGYMLQLAGLKPGECPEHWNITNKEKVTDLYRAYVEAGCDAIQTNTFSANRVQLEKHGLGDLVYRINYEGVKLAIQAAKGQQVYVIASVGPTGTLMAPSGELTFEKAYDVYKEQVKALVEGGVNAINFETFTDISEMRAAIIATKDITDIPVITSMAFEQNQRTLMGTTPFACAKIMLALKADIIGANCSFGPVSMESIVSDMARTGVVLSVKPNAGLPTLEDGITKYHQTADEFAQIVNEFPKYRANLVGGCCGTTPDFITAIKENIEIKEVEGVVDKKRYLFSLSKQICIDDVNKIGKIVFEDTMTIEDIIDNVYETVFGDYDIIELVYEGENENKIMDVINAAQNIIKQPIIITSKNSRGVEKALRIYSGIAAIRNAVENDYGALLI